MTKKLLGLKPLDYHADIVNMVEPIINLDKPTEQEEYIKKRIIEALKDTERFIMICKDEDIIEKLKGDVE